MFENVGKWVDNRFIGFRNWLDRKLVPTWRIWWKLWSMRLGVVSAALMTYLTTAPNALNTAMADLPAWLRDSLPAWVGPVMLGILFLTRFWDQSKVTRPIVVQPADDNGSDAPVQSLPAPVTHHGAE